MTKMNFEDSFKMYQLTIEMADRNSNRRLTANTFYLTLQSALIAAMCTLISSKGVEIVQPTFLITMFLLALLGVILSVAWMLTIKSYRDLSSAKWGVVLQLEKDFKIQPFSNEWKLLKAEEYKKWREEVSKYKKPKRIFYWLRERGKYYTPQSAVERYIPLVLLTLFLFITLTAATAGIVKVIF